MTLNPNDSMSIRVFSSDGAFHTICAGARTSGLNRSSVLVAATQPRRRQHIIALDGDKWKVRPDGNYARKGGNGLGVSEAEVMYTMTTVDRHIVAAVAV